jgi:hypothetical protein
VGVTAPVAVRCALAADATPLASQVVCTVSGTTSNPPDPFLCNSLPLPPPPLFPNRHRQATCSGRTTGRPTTTPCKGSASQPSSGGGRRCTDCVQCSRFHTGVSFAASTPLPCAVSDSHCCVAGIEAQPLLGLKPSMRVASNNKPNLAGTPRPRPKPPLPHLHYVNNTVPVQRVRP